MREYKTVLLIVYVPESHADLVRQAIGEAGAGKIGDYSFCSFSTKGVGRFLPGLESNPQTGNPGEHETVNEERIETVCDTAILEHVLQVVKDVHPYEEPAISVVPVISPDDFKLG